MTSVRPQAPSPRNQPLRVCVAVLTYRREQILAALLPSVIDQAGQTMNHDPMTTVRVLVVDNHAQMTARDVVAQAAAAARQRDLRPVAVDYAVEEAPGISAARNRALSEAQRAGEDVLVFLDDDEQPQVGWLSALLETFRSYDAAAVAGPVVATFESPPSDFLRGGEFFVLDRYRTGEVIEEAGSGNLLLDVQRLAQHGIRFDPEYGISGGEDTKLCRDLRAAGETIVWCDEALVLEPVPQQRATTAYAARRAVRQGSGWARLRLEDTSAGAPRARRRLTFALRGGAKAVRGGARAALARVRGDAVKAGAGAKDGLGGLGIAAAAAGVRLDGYQRPTPLSSIDVRTSDRLSRPRPVTVGVPTYRRAGQLADLLEGLLPQAAHLGASASGLPGDAGRRVRVVIVDNDPQGSACETVAGYQANAPELDLVYLHEPEPGVVAVRNTIIDAALPDGYLACIDDDEVPEDGWLDALVAAGERTGAAAVSGRVNYQLGPEADPWVARSAHFDAADRREDEKLPGASTANLLLDLYQLRIAGLRFDQRYSLTGGEDTRLTRDIQLAGGTVVAAPGARTREAVPADRATRAWVLKRAERNAESWARVRADVRPGEGARLPGLRRPHLALRGAARAAKGAVKMVRARRSKDPVAIAQAELFLAGAAGLVRGAAGINREEYARTKT